MKDWITWPGGEWKTVRLIGEGGYGAVYEIQREEFGRVYKAAMKVMQIPAHISEAEKMLDEGMTHEDVSHYYTDYVKRLSEEFALLATLKGYTNIVSYEDHKIIREPDGIRWKILIRMELLTPVNAYFREHSCNEETVIRLGTDMCRALEICHERNIIHRDIKLDNIFVNARGDFELGDFGIARITEETMSTMTIAGTPGYMAPEVYLKQKYGPNADLYSLGIVLYMLLNKKRGPFYPVDRRLIPDDRERALRERMSGRPVPEPIYGSAKLKKAVLKAIAFDPKDRYQTAEEFRKAFTEEEKEDPLEAPYRQALQMAESARTRNAYEKAEVAFNLLGDYKDSRERAGWCRTEAERLKGEAKPHEENVKAEKSAVSSKKRKPFGLIGLAGIGLVAALGLMLMIKGDQETEEHVAEEAYLPEVQRIAEAQVGEIVTFGRYEQDQDTSNGKEEIEWIVLEKEADKVLLISKAVLDMVPYQEKEADVTWETCSLRSWLNGPFMDAAFEEEKDAIQSTHLQNAENPKFGTAGGNETDDNVFCLSIDEAERYFKSDEERMGSATVYAKEQGIWVSGVTGASWWWLRSPGSSCGEAACVYDRGAVLSRGEYVSKNNGGVRPALWVKLDSADH